jgi:hypothetical protein
MRLPYLMVKNEHEFFIAFYYKPQYISDTNKDHLPPTGLDLHKFTGKLLLTNLLNKQSFLIDYENGHVSDSYRKMGLSVSTKIRTIGKTSYWQESCHTEIRHCRFISDGASYCGGGGPYLVVFREDCIWPSPMCGVTFMLEDYSEERVCQYVYFPDPPEPTNPQGPGGDGGIDGSIPFIDIDKRSMTTKYPCATKLVLDELEKLPFYNKMVLPFMQNGTKPTISWDAVQMPWGAGAVYQGGQTQSLTSGLGASSAITLNSTMIDNASQLLVSAVAIHETYHAYINYMFAFDISPSLYSKSQPSYMAGLYQYILYSNNGGGNYIDHYNMLTSQFDNFTNLLYDLGKGSYSMDECRMAMLFGMNSPEPNPEFGQAQFIATAYNDLLSKYGYTPQSIAQFNSAQINSVTENKQIPYTGCN